MFGMRFGLILLTVLILASLCVGVIGTGLDDLRDGQMWALIRDSRFPRTAAAVLTGAALAIAGQIMQLISRNRFVEPMTAGTGQSAALGILLVTIFAPAAPIWFKMGLASFAALVGSLGFFLIVRRLPPAQPMLVPLIGLVYGGVIGAGVTYVAYQADLLQFIEIWMNGEFSGTMRGRYELLWIVGVAAALTYGVADQFSILGLGETVSINLGLKYRQVMVLGLVMISVVTALTVVTVGIIPFVGLVVPNLVSRIAGDNLRASLPLTAMLGAGLVLAADLLGRVLIYPFEIPASTVIGVVGAVAFLWLLYGRGRHAG